MALVPRSRHLVSFLGALAFVSVGLVACGGGGGDGGGPPMEPNEPPTASISSPSDGASFDEGEEVTFQGSGQDPEDGTLSGSDLVWASDADGQLGTGQSVTSSDLSDGDHQITLTATDSDGATDEASVSITIRGAPDAEISSPQDDAVFSPGSEVTFQGSATDPEDGALSGDALVWESDVDGQLGTGQSVTTSSLSTANHEVTLTATDSDGLTDTEDVSITIGDPPSVSIDSPDDGALFQEGTEIDFAGSAQDPQDGELSGEDLVWTSDVDGEIGTGESVTTSDLSTGTHQISLTATDSQGLEGSASVTIEVNAAPTAEIDAPDDGAVVDEGTEVTFEGSAEDEEDGELGGDALVWTSDVDGEIGTGESVTTSDLSTGDHQITLTATDSDGATDSASISITVNAVPSASITSPGDGDAFGQGDEITFEGSGQDPEDGSLTGDALVWTSDVDGEIGTGETVTAALSIGTHQVTLTATDSDGATDTATVSVTVEQVPGSISVEPRFVRLLPGGSASLSASVQDVEGDAIENPDLEGTSRDPAVASATGTDVTAQADGVTDVVVEATSEFTDSPVADSSRVAVIQSDGFYTIVSRSQDSVAVASDAGATLELQFLIVPSPDAAGSIGSIEGSFTWDPAQLSFESGSGTQDASDRGWSVFENFTEAADGNASFSAFKTEGGTTEAFALLEMTFTVSGSAGAIAPIDVTIDAAGDDQAADITDKVEAVDSWVVIQ